MIRFSNTVSLTVLFSLAIGSVASQAWAATVVTTDPTIVTTFQTGASVLGFDALPPNGGGGSAGNTGIAIQPESQLSAQFANLGVVFSSTEGPAGVVGVQGLPNESDAKSPFNVIGGSASATPLPVLDYFQPITIQLVLPNTTTPALTNRVGAWNDPTGSRILLSAFDINGVLLESVEADQGFFVGISNPAIASATFSFITTQSVPGFSLDDVTLGPVNPVPLPASAWLFTSGLFALGVFRRRLSDIKNGIRD